MIRLFKDKYLISKFSKLSLLYYLLTEPPIRKNIHKNMYDRIRRINRLLLKVFGIPKKNKKNPDPVDLLIATILSQNTNDKNSYQAYKNLKEKFKSWEEVAELPLSKIEKTIKVAGLGKQKSKAIKNFLTKIINNMPDKPTLNARSKLTKTSLTKSGKISLDHFSEMDNDKILNELTSFKGIGIKTAACVLLFSLDRNVCPVDTHVHRTLNRIGLVKTSSPEKTFYIINEQLPDGIAHQFHTNLIRLGREICKPSKPKCTICPLLHNCKYDEKNLDLVSVKIKNDFMLLDEIH